MTRHFIPRAAMAACFAGALGACSAVETAPGNPGPTYDELLSDGRVIFNGATSTPVTPEADMPDSGSASYAGVAALAQGGPLSGIDDGQLLGTMEMEADFAGNAVSGRMGNFREEFTDTAHEGELALANGQVSGNGFTADISGELTPPGGATASYDGTLDGRFRGAAGEIVEGDVSGTITLPSSGTNLFYGLFAAGQI